MLRAELLLRAAAAYGDHDDSAALVHAWTASEGLLGDQLSAFLNEAEAKPTVTGADFISSERGKELLSRRTASNTAEFLALAGRIPSDLYDALSTSRQLRNAWLHGEEAVTSEQAIDAIRAAEQLFELVEGVRLALPLGRCFLRLW